jgi:hypothetical protein
MVTATPFQMRTDRAAPKGAKPKQATSGTLPDWIDGSTTIEMPACYLSRPVAL